MKNMSEILTIVYLFYGYLFLFSSINKLKNMEDHYNTVILYKIIPKQFIRIFIWLETLFEFFIGVGFLLGFATFYVIPGAILLLIIYTIAILINLVKGRVDFDCGCGGLVGAHKLSKNLVFRNILLIFVLIGGFTVQPFSLFAMAFDYKFFLMNSVYILGILVTLTSKEMFDLKQNIKLLTKGE
ncbi:hypothetical protein CN424_22730 [Bacillus cereus]|nr:hypothetical protein CN424_22730 [Bacillus cereus]